MSLKFEPQTGDAGKIILESQGGNDVLNNANWPAAPMPTRPSSIRADSDVITNFTAGAGQGHDFLDFCTALFAGVAAVAAAISQVVARVAINGSRYRYTQ